MATYRIAILDDEQSQLDVYEMALNSYNRNSINNIQFDLFTDYKEFLEKFNHDLAVLDMDLKCEVGGFRVGKELLKKHPDAIILTRSSNFKDDEKYESALPKSRGIKISEIVSLLLMFKKNHTYNLLQFFKLAERPQYACFA